MQKGDFIFVYGTLRRGQHADLTRSAHNFGASFRGEDDINGLMYHLHAYPGVQLLKDVGPAFDGDKPTIHGEVFLIREQALVSLLDCYEGYDADNPTQGLYNRCEVETKRGRKVWVYIYNGRVTKDQLIDGGDWCKCPDLPMRHRVLG